MWCIFKKPIHLLPKLRECRKSSILISRPPEVNFFQNEPSLSLEIEFKDLSKTYGDVIALRDFSGFIHKGDRICVLGHNGAGKSTLLSMLSTLTKPSSGELVFREGDSILTNKLEIRKRMAFLSHQAMMYPDLTALENLRFVARMAMQQTSETHLLALLEEVGIGDAAHRLFRTFSRGMQQKASLARALLSKPQLLLLDEPFSGLDYQGVDRLKSLFTQGETSWVLVTHHFSLGYELANQFWILKKGKLLHQFRKADISFETFLQIAQGAGERL